MAVTTVGMAPMRRLTVVRNDLNPVQDGRFLKETPTPKEGSTYQWAMLSWLPALPCLLLSLSVSPCPLYTQKARRAALPPSPALAPMCVSLSAGSVMATRIALTVQMRASLLAAVSRRGPEEWVGSKHRSLTLQMLANEVKGRKNFSFM